MDTGIATLARRTALCKLTSGQQGTMPKITHIALGNGGVDAAGEPVPPQEGQQELRRQIAVLPVDGVEYPVPTTARYTLTLGMNELVGEKINEVGLVDEAGVLMTIKTMYTKQKDADVAMVITVDDEY